MRKILFLATVIVVLVTSYSIIQSQPTGTPAPASGGPAEANITCSQSGCHTGSPSLVNNFITTDIPSTGYVPGRIYNLTVSFTGTGNKGFQISPQDSVGNKVGTLLSGTGSKLNTFNNVGYITHTAAKSSSTATWNFQWQAPLRGTGRFSFYGAFAITKSSTKRQSVLISENKTLPTITTQPAAPIQSNIAVINATANANSGVYNVSFQYKPEGGNWTFINGTPSNVSGDSLVQVSIPVPGLIPGKKYIYRACAWNKGDTTWADTLSFITNLTGLEETRLLNQVLIFPQPAINELNVQFHLVESAPVTVSLYTLNGERLQTHTTAKLSTGKQQLTLPVQTAKGIYLLQLQVKEQQVVQKIMLQ